MGSLIGIGSKGAQAWLNVFLLLGYWLPSIGIEVCQQVAADL